MNGDDLTEPNSLLVHGIFQVDGRSPKFMVAVTINGVQMKMEIDIGTECSSIPATLFQEKLRTVCKLMPSQVTLQQYDQTQLKVASESMQG